MEEPKPFKFYFEENIFVDVFEVMKRHLSEEMSEEIDRLIIEELKKTKWVL